MYTVCRCCRASVCLHSALFVHNVYTQYIALIRPVLWRLGVVALLACLLVQLLFATSHFNISA